MKTKVYDSFFNMLNGIGLKNLDPRQHIEYKNSSYLSDKTLDDIYSSNGIGAKIVKVRTQDMLRAGYEVIHDKDEEIKTKLKSLKLMNILKKALEWDDVYGGALVVFIINDGSSSLSTPLNVNKIKSIDYLEVFDRTDVTIRAKYDIHDFDKNKLNNKDKFSKIGKPKIYTVNTDNGVNFDVHESRTYAFRGHEVPERIHLQYEYFGISLYQLLWEELKLYGSTISSIGQILDNFITGVLGIKELTDILMMEDGSEIIRRRLDAMDLSKSMLNTMLIDTEETFEKKSSSVSGLADLCQEVQKMLGADVNMPQTILMGQSPAGMNATGDSDVRLWYDRINFEQNIRLFPFYEYVIELLQKSSEISNKDDKVTVEFLPLWQPTMEEQAKSRKANAEADAIYVTQVGSVSSDEVRTNNYGDYTLDFTKDFTPEIPSDGDVE